MPGSTVEPPDRHPPPAPDPGRPESADRGSVGTLFPPRDADPRTRAEWLARPPWPEIVFACVA